jgi:hypothetical protein
LEVGTGEGASAPVAATASTPKGTTAEQIVKLWNEMTRAPLPRCQTLTDERRRRIRARVSKLPALADWRRVFERIQASQFCRGEIDGRNGQTPWVADLDWVIKNDTNLARVLEGRFDDRAGPVLMSQRSGENREAMRVAGEVIKAHATKG